MKPALIPTFAITLLLAFSTSSQAQQHPRQTDPFAGLDTAFARVLKNWHVAGFAVAVVKKDSIIWSRGFGYRDLGNQLPVTPQTVFAIGSCTKSFTASLIGILDAAGRLSIDKPVRNYLPELKFYNPEMDNTITLRDMMCHRTGLPRYDLSWFIFPAGSRDSLLRRIQYMEPTAGIREKWQYNNFMFGAQGWVVQKITGHTWEDNIREKFFLPLGMTASSLSVKELQKSPEASLGYGVKKDSLIQKLDYHVIDEMAPAGAINSNVREMAAWLETWINGGKYKGNQIIPAGYAEQAMSSQMAMGTALPAKGNPDIYLADYGFGWMISSYRGHYLVEHGGNIDGFSANMAFFPSDSIGIVVLTNQDASQVPSIVSNIMADRLLHLAYKDWNTTRKNAADKGRAAIKEGSASRVSDRKPGTSPSHPLKDYTGLFSNPAYGGFEITLERDSLFAHFPTQTWWLKHYHYDVFDPFDKNPDQGIDTTGDDSGIRLQFLLDQAGNINSLSIPLDPTLAKPTVFTRIPKEQQLSVAELQKYVGEYTIATVVTRVYIKKAGLYLLVPGQPEYELAPVGTDKFALKALSGYTAQFLLDEKGIVTGVLAIQPNGTFKMQKKK